MSMDNNQWRSINSVGICKYSFFIVCTLSQDLLFSFAIYTNLEGLPNFRKRCMYILSIKDEEWKTQVP